MDWKEALSGLKANFEESSPEPLEEKKIEPIKNHTNEDILHSAKVQYERKGRGGKEVTILHGFTCGDDEVKTLARRLKQLFGTGGSVRGGEILLQGDWRTEIENLRK